MEYAINVKDLSFRWPDNPAFDLSVRNWQVNKGQKVFLYGPSGSGKSTLLNLLSGVLSGYSGQLRVLDCDFASLNGAQRDQFRAANIGMIFQQFNLLPYLTGLDNILLAEYFRPATKPAPQNELLAQLCDKLQLSSSLLKQSAATMSVGQQQRIAVARALINQPQLIIADEPSSALDSELRDRFIELLLDMTQANTVLFVSHDRSLATHFDTHCNMPDLRGLSHL